MEETSILQRPGRQVKLVALVTEGVHVLCPLPGREGVACKGQCGHLGRALDQSGSWCSSSHRRSRSIDARSLGDRARIEPAPEGRRGGSNPACYTRMETHDDACADALPQSSICRHYWCLTQSELHQRYPQQFAPLAVRQAHLSGEPELSRHRWFADLPT